MLRGCRFCFIYFFVIPFVLPGGKDGPNDDSHSSCLVSNVNQSVQRPKKKVTRFQFANTCVFVRLCVRIAIPAQFRLHLSNKRDHLLTRDPFKPPPPPTPRESQRTVTQTSETGYYSLYDFPFFLSSLWVCVRVPHRQPRPCERADVTHSTHANARARAATHTNFAVS